MLAPVDRLRARAWAQDELTGLIKITRDAHRPDERVDLDEVVDCARTFSNLIARAPALLEGGRETLPARAAKGSS
jgi:hypothetical protein